MGRLVTRGLICLALVTATAATARADIIYSNLGPGGTWDATSLPTRETIFDVRTFHLWWGTPFTPDVTGRVQFVTLPLQYSGDGTGIAQVSLTASNNGVPGTIIESFALAFTLPQPGSLVSWQSLVRPVLQAGTTYFLTLHTTGGDSDNANWFFSPRPESLIATREDGADWSLVSNPPLALHIQGDVVSATPEPATMVLLASGLAAGALSRRRGKERGDSAAVTRG